MIGYKVVQRNLSSSFSKSPVQYQVGVPTSRPVDGGPLAVFETLEDALNYQVRGEHIFKCKYTPSKDESLWYRMSYFQDPRERFTFGLKLCPDGTKLADEVTLLKEVEPNEF